jgi:hypothetical protein
MSNDFEAYIREKLEKDDATHTLKVLSDESVSLKQVC